MPCPTTRATRNSSTTSFRASSAALPTTAPFQTSAAPSSATRSFAIWTGWPRSSSRPARRRPAAATRAPSASMRSLRVVACGGARSPPWRRPSTACSPTCSARRPTTRGAARTFPTTAPSRSHQRSSTQTGRAGTRGRRPATAFASPRRPYRRFQLWRTTGRLCTLPSGSPRPTTPWICTTPLKRLPFAPSAPRRLRCGGARLRPTRARLRRTTAPGTIRAWRSCAHRL
mmetsp:Transcript_10126/g.35621  ORF Transcript_10126/g.35621 Transcript_10126/m.35621 type:complete len:229 (+) Transcript_10126:630-1316(+)